MTQVLRDSHGHKIGEIQESCGKKSLETNMDTSSANSMEELQETNMAI